MMPIVIKDCDWSQNGEYIFIVLEIKGVRTASVDIVSSPTYLKVHIAPFIFEAFLSSKVEDEDGECTVDENSEKVSFRLKKVFAGEHWECLENKELTKEEKSVKRAEAVRITQERSEKEKSEKQKRRFDRKQTTVHDQIKLDSEERERVEKIKSLAGNKALTEFNEWATSSNTPNASGDVTCGKQTEKALPTLEGSEDLEKAVRKEMSLSRTTWSLNDELKSRKSSKQIFEEPEANHPVAIRPTACISVSFTPRTFPTPSRESTHVEEQEWLKKQTEARRLSGFVDEDLRPEERNPQWLLDKGLSLMRTESYLGAISAFSLGIRLAPKMPELFVERAGAHLAVKNYNRTVADSTQALELLTPKVHANLEDRLKCHVCRGKAFRELEMWEEALSDYKEAILLKPDEELTSARDEIQKSLEAAVKEKQEWENKERAKRTVNTSTSPHTTTSHHSNGGGSSSEED